MKNLEFGRIILSSCVAAAMLAGCGGSQPPIGALGEMPQGLAPGLRPAVLARSLPQGGSPSQYIKNVVVIVQENRSLENFFAGYPGANAPTSGCAIPKGSAEPRARQVVRRGSSSACPPGDISVPLQQITFDGIDGHNIDLKHNWYSSTVDYHKGKMDGFSRWGKPNQYPAYSYVEQSLIAPYWDMAQQYVLADEMFPTEFGGSFTAHLTLVAGTDNIKQSPSEAEVDFPTEAPDDCDSYPGTVSSYLTSKDVEHRFKGPFPCFDQWDTMANVLDKAGVSWKYYATKLLDGGLWEPFEAMKYVRYGPDWNTDIIAPQTQVLNDAADGNLASVNWVTPEPRRFRSSGVPQRSRSVVGSIGGQRGRRELILELHGDHHPVGRLGRLVRQLDAAAARLSRARFPRSLPHHLALRQARLCRSHAVRVRQHPEVHRRGQRHRSHRAAVTRLHRHRAQRVWTPPSTSTRNRAPLPRFPRSIRHHSSCANRPHTNPSTPSKGMLVAAFCQSKSRDGRSAAARCRRIPLVAGSGHESRSKAR